MVEMGGIRRFLNRPETLILPSPWYYQHQTWDRTSCPFGHDFGFPALNRFPEAVPGQL